MFSVEVVEFFVKVVRNGEVDVFMKGNILIVNILKVVLNKEWGLCKGSVFLYVVVFEVLNYDCFIFVIDVVMNIVFDVI